LLNHPDVSAVTTDNNKNWLRIFILTTVYNNYIFQKEGATLSHTLKGMEIANITDESLQKLQEAEKSINSTGDTEEIYLMALKKQGG
jgi:hypothetical protein